MKPKNQKGETGMRKRNVPVVILCGGRGTRLVEETEYRPKPLVEIGGKPILWHILKGYSHYGFRSFILCLGYKGNAIKEYFLNYEVMSNDFRLNTRTKARRILNAPEAPEDWEIILADTGKDTNTGGRIKRVEKYIKSAVFMATYGDGIADINIQKLLEYHLRQGKIATISGFHPRSKYGQVWTSRDGKILSFREKPRLRDTINGGFFVFNREFLDHLDEDCVLEHKPFERLVAEKQMALYNHPGFWFAVDTYKDYLDINEMCRNKQTPWMVWE
jgi:glucose-1-phosphate cytidylyltransferase